MHANHSTVISLLLVSVILTGCPDTIDSNVVETSVKYRLTFSSSWNLNTHPTNTPANPHFSGLIGATHNANASFWSVGTTASAGIEIMAETGAKTPLDDEIGLAQANGSAEFLLSGGSIPTSPGEVMLEFGVNLAHPLVTIVSMVAPSPDWFVGVDSLNLIENGRWVEEKIIELEVYDAGSDDGLIFDSLNSDSNPKQAISKLTSNSGDTDFMSGLPIVGTFTFVKIQ